MNKIAKRMTKKACIVIKEEEFDISNFQFWSGALDSYEILEYYDLVEEFEYYINYNFEELTETQINDILWFDLDAFLEGFGYSTEQYYKEKQ